MANAERIKSTRRYFFLKMWQRLNEGNSLAADVWDEKRQALGGTEIPSGFPARTKLVDRGRYLVLEEVDGADTTELTNAGLTEGEASQVLAAL